MKKTAFTLLILAFSVCAFSQDEEESKDKFFAGGNFGLALGRYTLINLNPQIGYRFNRFVSAGLGMNLIYASQKEQDQYGRNFSKLVTGVTGINVFTRLYPVQRFFAQVQGEENYIFGSIKYYDTGMKTKIDASIVPSVLIGGGMATPTNRGAMVFTLLYDVLQKDGSPYGNRPVVNVGYNFNF